MASLPPAYTSTDSLPDYRQSLQSERSPAYTPLTLSSTRTSSSEPSSLFSQTEPLRAENFVFQSKHLKLDLGPRQWAPQLPAYGRNGLVEGHVGIESYKHVDRVELTLTGVVLCHMISNGVPSLREIHVVLSEKSTIWSSNQAIPEADTPFPFVFPLPNYASGPGYGNNTTTPLPPSASVSGKSSNAHVFYYLKLDMFRRGIRFHDSVQTEILYLPRTVSHYERPYIPLPGSEKPRRICDSEWRTAEVTRKPDPWASKPKTNLPGLSDVNVFISLPHKLHYPSGCAIPVAVTLSGPGLSCANIPQLTAGLRLTLVKTATVIVRGIVEKQETVVSTGNICRIDEDERHWRNSKPGDNSRQIVIRGCLETGTKGKDVSWGVRGHAGVSYQVRVSLAPSVGADIKNEAASTMWEHSEAVVITSHEWEGRAAVGVPALSLPASSRNPATISLLHGA